MIDKVKKAVYAIYNPEEEKGCFLSGFSKEKKLVFSQWVVVPTQVLGKTLEELYETYAEPKRKETRYIVCDIVLDVIEYTDTPKDFLALSPEEYWFLAIDKEDDISWVILPHTAWVVDVKSALYDLKKKYGIHGQVELYAFRTRRLVIAK